MTTFLAALVFAPAPLVLNLSPDNWTLTAGETFKAKLRYSNQSQATLAVVPMNASEQYVRKAPRGHLEVRRVGHEKWLKLTGLPGCGNTNPIQVSDFQVLKAGESAVRQAWFPWIERVVGKENMVRGQYDVRYVYDTSEPIDNWIGGPIPEPAHSERREQIRSLFDRTPHGVYDSGPTRVTLR